MEKLKKKFSKRHADNSGKSDESDEGWSKDVRTPPVRTIDRNDGSVRLEILIPRLEPTNEKHRHKYGVINFDFCNDGWGFDMETVFKDSTKKEELKWRFRVMKFPSQIDIADSKWHAEKGRIIVTMQKAQGSRDIPWTNLVNKYGLDQSSSSSSPSSDDDV